MQHGLGRDWRGDFHRGAAIDLAPDTAWAGNIVHFDLYLGAVHAVHRLVEAAHLFGVAHDIVADQGPPEAPLAGIRVAAVDDGAVEEEHIAGFHDHRADGHPLWDWHGDIGEAGFGVGALNAENGQIL